MMSTAHDASIDISSRIIIKMNIIRDSNRMMNKPYDQHDQIVSIALCVMLFLNHVVCCNVLQKLELDKRCLQSVCDDDDGIIYGALVYISLSLTPLYRRMA